MKLQYLGTAAAEGIPAIFCDCPTCKAARARGGHAIRGRAGSILDDTIKLDFGPDSFAQMLQFGLDYSRVNSIIITHSHEDHFSIHDIAMRVKGFSHITGDPVLTVYGNGKVGSMLREQGLIGEDIQFRLLRPFVATEIEGYKVTPLDAVHFLDNSPNGSYPVQYEGKTYTRTEQAFFYLIEKDGKKLLYAHDTDLFTPGDVEFLAGKHIDCISLDCNNGGLVDTKWIGHMSAAKNKIMKDRFMANGAADEHTHFVANHFSHNGYVPEEELQALLPGFTISYDGLTVEI